MCGIYGGTFEYESEILEKKIKRLYHRGPNFQKISTFITLNGKRLIMGHTRLSIIDLDARSNQPFEYNDSIVIVYNGEIYNYKELKATYLNQTILKTSSDTEVICAMYERFGARCVDFFNGMFAFVIFDKRRNILFGARDRLGKKPLYYRWGVSGMEFASQSEALHIGNIFTVDSKARQFYLLKGYIPEPYCIWNEVRKLCAGCCFEYQISSNRLKIESYWDLFSNSCGLTKPKSYGEAKEVVKALLEDAVKMRLQADVPIGMFLSGGIDSALTSALAAKIYGSIHAYTIGFEDPCCDESKFTKAIAAHLNIPLTILKCTDNEAVDMLDKYSSYFDEPFSDCAAIPASLLAQGLRTDATVAIGGDGGDELFGGYNSYYNFKRALDISAFIPYFARKQMYKFLYWRTGNNAYDFLCYQNVVRKHLYKIRYGEFGDAIKCDLKAVADELPAEGYVNNTRRGVLAAMDYDMKEFLNSGGNTKSDRSSMRFGLELRCPLMDYRLAEYSRLLPYEYMWSKGLGGKRIIKDILYSIVPKSLMDRPKHGFTVPMDNWIRGKLKREVLDLLTYQNVVELIPELDVEKMMKYRDGLKNLIKAQMLPAVTYFKIYIYLKWAQDIYCG